MFSNQLHEAIDNHKNENLRDVGDRICTSLDILRLASDVRKIGDAIKDIHENHDFVGPHAMKTQFFPNHVSGFKPNPKDLKIRWNDPKLQSDLKEDAQKMQTLVNAQKFKHLQFPRKIADAFIGEEQGDNDNNFIRNLGCSKLMFIGFFSKKRQCDCEAVKKLVLNPGGNFWSYFTEHSVTAFTDSLKAQIKDLPGHIMDDKALDEKVVKVKKSIADHWTSWLTEQMDDQQIHKWHNPNKKIHLN